MLKTTSTNASTPTCQSVRRARTESSMSLFLGREHVAFAAPCVQQFQFVPVINFTAQALHIDFDQIGEDVEVCVPDVRGDVCTPHHAVGVACEVFEQRILFGGQ